MLAGDGNVRVHDLRPRFREGKSVSEHTQCSPVVVRVSNASWARLCHLGHVLCIIPGHLLFDFYYT